jgi:hypothetical protein
MQLTKLTKIEDLNPLAKKIALLLERFMIQERQSAAIETKPSFS